MVKARKRVVGVVATLAAALLTVLQFGPMAASGGEISDASAAAFGVNLEGLVDALPSVSAAVPPGQTDSAEDSILEVPADPLLTSFTGHVEADAGIDSRFTATLKSVASGLADGLPSRWNSRGYAIVEDLEAVMDTITADVIESESTVACDDGGPSFATGVRIANLAVAGTEVPLLDATPNEVVFDNLGIRIVFWETNWDPATNGTTDGSSTVFANAIHVTVDLEVLDLPELPDLSIPGMTSETAAGQQQQPVVDLIVSHSEADGGSCVPGPGPRPAPPAEPVPGAPNFAG